MTFFLDIADAPYGLIIEARDMADALRQFAAYKAGLNLPLEIERVSRSKTRGLTYERKW